MSLSPTRKEKDPQLSTKDINKTPVEVPLTSAAKGFDAKLIQASLIKQKFNEEFKKKFSPFLNYSKSSNK